MMKEKINWRTFDDEDVINPQRNLPASPSMYIIDHQGTIRRKWVGKVGEKTIDAALDKLIHEAEQSARSEMHSASGHAIVRGTDRT